MFNPNQLRGRIMRPLKSSLSYSVLLLACILVFCLSSTFAQDKAGVPKSSGVSSAKKSPDEKTTTPRADAPEAGEQATAGESWDDEGTDQIRKREEWFYKQRSSANGHIPGGARNKAFQHMQRMMEAEGKLVRRADGTYAAASGQAAFTPQGAVTSAWTSIGPTPTTGGFFSPVTGRVTTIAVDPSDPTGNTVLIGGAMGGIWRSTDAGATWTAVGDQNASLAMGSIAFANPSSPGGAGLVYAGTGESAGVGFDVYYGAGVLKSTDSGQTWTQTCTMASATCPFIGPYDDITPFGFFTLGGTRITYIAVNPSNPLMVLVGAQTQFAQGPTEGVYCTDNGGSTWSNILPDQLSSFVGFASSSVAYAALGNPYGSSPNAPNGNGIYKATGTGSTCSTIHFARLTSASLPPQSSMGRIDLGIAPSDPTGNTVYASIADASINPVTGFRRASRTNLGVFKTIDGGNTWTNTNAPDICQRQCWYDNVIKVDPNNANIAFFGGGAVRDSSGNFSWVVRTEDGGSSWPSVIPNLPPGSSGLPHVDNHAIAFVKLSNGKVRMYLGNDGGIWRTDDAEGSPVTWINLNNPSLTLTQFYPSISINASSPSIAFGGTQDNGTQNYAGSPNWTDIRLCGDGTGTAIDALIPSSVYVACNGIFLFSSYQNGTPGTFGPAINGINPADFFNFVPPLTVDPFNANTLYVGTTKVYQSVDAAFTWTPISYDLVNGSNFDSLTALAVSPTNSTTNSSVVYAGADSGQVFIASTVTRNGNATFVRVSGQGSLPPRAVTAIAVDSTDSTGNTAYVTFSGFSFVNTSFGVNDPTGHIFKTTDGGNTWKDVSCSVAVCTNPATTDLPNIPVNDAVIDPDVPGTIYAATDLGVFVGNCTVTSCTWSTLSTGLPRVVVHSLRLHEPSRTLRAATHGRGAWDINLNNFIFSGPHVSSITPTNANAGGPQFTLTVNGTGLTGGSIQWNGSATGVTMLAGGTDTTLSATIAPSLLVAGTAKVTVQVGTATSNSLTFAVLAAVPTLTAINPPSTPVQTPNPTMSISIQLTGTGFANGAKVLFNGAQNGITVAAPTSSCPLPTCLTATLPAALLGPFGSTDDISVLNTPPGGGKSQPLTFRVAAPPPLNDNFAKATNITTLTFNDVQDSSGATTETPDPVPPCVLQFSASQGNTGGQKNGVYNTIWYKYTPVFSANLNVDTIGSTYDTVLSIWTGTGTTEATLTATNVACNDDINPGIAIQSQLSNVSLTAGTSYYIMVSSFGPPDPNPIALGGKSVFNFVYNFGLSPAPTITSLLPTSANSGDPSFTLTVNGSSFLPGAIIDFNNSTTGFGNALVTTYVNPTQLTGTVPASAIQLPGPFTINVLNPLPTVGPSNYVNFTVNVGSYPVPTLGPINPASAIAGSLPFSIIAPCANCASSAVLNFNGVAKPTVVSNSFSSPYQQNVSATISTADISTPGTVQVTVSNPTPGGGPSAPQSFTITQPTVVPTIASVSPASIPAGSPTTVTITGTGFIQGAAVYISGAVGYWGANVTSSTQLSLSNLSVPTPGTYPLYVVDPAPAGTSTAFMLTVTQPPAPTITSISPTTAPNSSSPTLTITGSGFEPGASVLFNSSNYGATFSSSTQLSVVLPLTGIAAGTYPIAVVDPAPAGTSNAVNFTVTGPPPDFSLNYAGATSATVAAGQTATFINAVYVFALNGFTGMANLSCSLPAAATQCSVSPSSVPPQQAATITVTTTARGLLPPLWPRMRYISRPQFLPVLLLAIVLSALLLRLAQTRRQRFAGALPLAGLVLFLMLQTVGCGGGTSYTPPPPTGTPAGTYTVTVTATASSNSGTLTHTTTLTLVVQ